MDKGKRGCPGPTANSVGITEHRWHGIIQSVQSENKYRPSFCSAVTLGTLVVSQIQRTQREFTWSLLLSLSPVKLYCTSPSTACSPVITNRTTHTHTHAHTHTQRTAAHLSIVSGWDKVTTENEWVLRLDWTKTKYSSYTGIYVQWLLELCVWYRSLYSIHSCILSQRRDLRIVEIRQHPLASTTAQARKYCICRRWFIWHFGRLVPYWKMIPYLRL